MTTILVIEDESQTREIFLRCLTFEGFEAIGATNGTTGIELARSHQPDLIVCDIMMPDLDGYEVLSQVRQMPHTAAIPFIFLTAKATMADLRCGMQLGADDYLTKPCTVEQLLTAIATRLARQATLKQCYVDLPSPATVPPPTHLFPDCPKLASAFAFIESCYAQPISLRDVAEAAGYSPAYLTHLAQTLTGRTVNQWITARRMMQARSLLTRTSQTISQIATSVGYNDVGHFIRQFRQLHGLSPKAWRNAPAQRATWVDAYQAG